jgi:putative phage-type endonuclease
MTTTTEAFERLPVTIPENPNEASPERDAWLAAHREAIGSSDAAAACGLSRWKTEYQLYLEKRGELAEEDLSNVRRVRMGHRNEPSVAAEYELETGRKLERVPNVLQSKEFPFMRASLDRVVVGERRIVELKTAGFWAGQQYGDWGPSGTDLAPLEYVIQCAHQMLVTGYTMADLAVIINLDDLRIYPLVPNQQIFDLLIERETEFWQRVIDGNPPAPRTLNDTALKFPRAQELRVQATTDIAMMVGEMQDLKRQIKEREEQFDLRKLEVQNFMGDGNALYLNNDRIATWTNSSRSDIDRLRFISDMPDIAAKYARTSNFRVFKIMENDK